MKAVEVKVKASSVGTLAASISVALLNGLVANSVLLGSLPPWIQFIIITAVPPLVTFLSGYATPSSTSTVSDKYVDSRLH